VTVATSTNITLYAGERYGNSNFYTIILDIKLTELD
jgi:hypothetical protein